MNISEKLDIQLRKNQRLANENEVLKEQINQLSTKDNEADELMQKLYKHEREWAQAIDDIHKLKEQYNTLLEKLKQL